MRCFRYVRAPNGSVSDSIIRLPLTFSVSEMADGTKMCLYILSNAMLISELKSGSQNVKNKKFVAENRSHSWRFSQTIKLTCTKK